VTHAYKGTRNLEHEFTWCDLQDVPMVRLHVEGLASVDCGDCRKAYGAATIPEPNGD
jgi:hypothetical protein